MSFSVIKKTSVALALMASAVAANATNFFINGLNDTYVNSAYVEGSFSDTYYFHLPSQYNGVLGGFVGIDWTGGGLDTHLTLRLDDPAVRSGAILSVDLPVNDVNNGLASYQSILSLQPGSYQFTLSGYAEAATYTVTLAPVPEPETYALLLAGLGLFGVIGRRRQSK